MVSFSRIEIHHQLSARKIEQIFFLLFRRRLAALLFNLIFRLSFRAHVCKALLLNGMDVADSEEVHNLLKC
jgi:hypothetical protein